MIIIINVCHSFKGSEIICSLDFITKLETGSFNYILNDFNFITQVHIYTDKCGPKDQLRFEEANKRPERITISEFLCK